MYFEVGIPIQCVLAQVTVHTAASSGSLHNIKLMTKLCICTC